MIPRSDETTEFDSPEDSIWWRDMEQLLHDSGPYTSTIPRSNVVVATLLIDPDNPPTLEQLAELQKLLTVTPEQAEKERELREWMKQNRTAEKRTPKKEREAALDLIASLFPPGPKGEKHVDRETQ